jgi:hypothetical protein
VVFLVKSALSRYRVLMCKRLTILTIALLCFTAASAQAGMPTIELADVAKLRLSSISFFIVVFLLCGGAIVALWNETLVPLIDLPKITFKKALGLLLVWGLLFTLILTMISGARELMTPGAWKKKSGKLTYELTDPGK